MEVNGKKLDSTIVVVALALAACLICAMSDGVRNNYGIMLSAIIENSGLTYATVSLVLAIGQFFYGMIQPFFGVLAQKRGSTFTLLVGVGLMLAGLFLLPHCKSAVSLIVCLGLLLPSGTGATSYGILIGSITPRMSEKTVSLVSGVVNASSGVGNALLSPIIQSLLASGGIAVTMGILAIPTALMIPLCLFIGHMEAKHAKEDAKEHHAGPNENATEAKSTKVLSGAASVDEPTSVEVLTDKTPAAKPASVEATATNTPGHSGPAAASALSIFVDAFHSRTYRLLMIGFFTCGFHMALISNHLPSQFTSYGITAEVSAYAFSIYGIVTMVGSVLSGWFTGRFEAKNVLGVYYASRIVVTLIFILAPKTPVSAFVYAAFLGLTGAATVPPVSGLIGREFGAARVAALYGFVFFVHQIGGFLGAWLGGLCVEAFGVYEPVWMVDMALCAVAATASFLIHPAHIEQNA